MSDAARLIARLALVAVFLVSGWDKFAGGLDGFAGSLARKGVPMAAGVAPVAAGVELGAALLVALGIFARPAALLLILFTAVATGLTHLFWTFPDEMRADQALQFWKNVGLAGGLLLLAIAGPGRFSLRPANH